MKKNYSAPKLLLERFELKQSITESCNVVGDDSAPGKGIGTPSLADKVVCGWRIGEGMILWPSAPVCTVERSVDAEIGELCYNGPGGSGNGYVPFIS